MKRAISDIILMFVSMWAAALTAFGLVPFWAAALVCSAVWWFVINRLWGDRKIKVSCFIGGPRENPSAVVEFECGDSRIAFCGDESLAGLLDALGALARARELEKRFGAE